MQFYRVQEAGHQAFTEIQDLPFIHERISLYDGTRPLDMTSSSITGPGVIKILKIINYEDPENRHFIKRYKLVTKSLILVNIVDGEQTDWTNLKLVWERTAHRLLASAAGFFETGNIFPDLFPHMSVKVQPHVA